MGQVYEPVEKFDVALAASGYTEAQFMALNGLGLGAITEWRRNRSRLAPRWAIVQATLLAELRQARGAAYMEIKEVPPSEYITMSATWGKTRFGEEAWILANGEIFTDDFTPPAIKNDPLWERLTPGQKKAYLSGAPGITPILTEFYDRWCAPS